MERQTPRPRRAAKIAVIILAVLTGALACAYLGCCAWVSSQDTFFPGYHIENVDVGGMTTVKAAKALEAELIGRTFSVWLDSEEGEPDIILTAEQLGLLPGSGYSDYASLAQTAYAACRSGNFLTSGYHYLRSMLQGAGTCYVLPSAAEAICLETAQDVAKKLSILPVDAEYTVEGDSLITLIPMDGRTVNAQTLADALNAVRLEAQADKRKVVVPSILLPAKVLTAQQIHSYVQQDVLNARYDQATGTILPEVIGIDFDMDAAQRLMDASVPGAYATFRLNLTYPAVTAEILKPVLFRDVLATYTTDVAGTNARKNNVRLSAKAINGLVLNYGDVFSYNESVGQRTAARGYQAAPAYVNGQTVNEIGGGICQTSSTLYMSCLLANLEITERRPHRYATTYMPFGMDATVSWGGPDYKFTNNTDYPIRIETKYQNDQLTVTLYGTKTDDITVKMTYEYLEKIEWTTVYEEDPTMAPGTQKVKTSAYTGHKVQTYRELYDGEGSLISRTKEAYSYYKSRDRVVVRGPALPEAPAETPAVSPTPDVTEPPADTPSAGEDTMPDTGETTPPDGDTPETETPVEGNPPAVDPPAPEAPSAGDGGTADMPSDVTETPVVPDEALPPA